MRRRIHPEALVYTITKHVGRDGVNLSKAGHWGGVPFVDRLAASEAARDDAEGRPYRVDVKRVETLRPVVA